MKCLPATKVPSAAGVVLHDWHAEILALRAFNRFLTDECAALVSSSSHVSAFVKRRDSSEISRAAPQPFAIKSDVEIHMYCSEAPCGDASMELTMDAQEDPTPWATSTSPTDGHAVLRGRGYFSELGVVRRKPGTCDERHVVAYILLITCRILARPDAPPTLSKSCTDKIALKQCTSLLNATTAHLLAPQAAYLRTLILPESQHVPAATTRAFSPSGRMAPLAPEEPVAWPQGYAFRPFEVRTTPREFEWSRRSGQPGQKLVPCNLSALYTPTHTEVIINGALQGRKQGDPKGASVVSRRAMWSSAVDIAKCLQLGPVPEVEQLVLVLVESEDYASLKQSSILLERERVKELAKARALSGWAENVADGSFNLK